jgi:hypothetical protein
MYEIVPRHFPELPEQARRITESQARVKLLELYFGLVGAAQLRGVTKLFSWSNEITNRDFSRSWLHPEKVQPCEKSQGCTFCYSYKGTGETNLAAFAMRLACSKARFSLRCASILRWTCGEKKPA